MESILKKNIKCKKYKEKYFFEIKESENINYETGK